MSTIAPENTMADFRPAALFDFDKTLTRHDSLKLLLGHMVRTIPGAARELGGLLLRLLPYAAGLVSKEAMKTRTLRMLCHLPAGDRGAFLHSFCREILAGDLLRQGIERVEEHRRQKQRLVLVSASVDLYMVHLQRMLGFDHLVCTRTASVANPVVVGANCYGREKIRRLEKLPWFDRVDWASSWGYSDSDSDLPMLELCGHPVATNPNRALRRLAAREGWEIADW